MEDSVEDYIKISKNTREDPTENIKLSNEILATAQRKKECEEYALKIVMFLLDGKLRTEIFLKCLKYINQDYYQDVVDERAISKLCGYPLCGKRIPEMPLKKYFISTKVNKVYDISERKNYCSNFCYKASLHIKHQIDSSPLWVRSRIEMPEYNLLHPTVIGTPGEEIDYGISRPSSDLPQFTSVTHFTEMSLEEVEKIENSKGSSIFVAKHKTIQKQHSLNVIKEEDGGDDNSQKGSCTIPTTSNNVPSIPKLNNHKASTSNEVSSCQSNIHSDTLPTNAMGQKDKLGYLISKLKINNEPKTKLIDPPPIKLQKKNKVIQDHNVQKNTSAKIQQKEVQNENNANMEISTNIKACVKEWITLDTFIFLYGEDKVRQVLNENKMGDYFEKLRIVDLETPQQLKYMNICRRLHMQEMVEEKFDNAALGHSLNLLPDFKQLKKDVLEVDSKVKSFYKGALYEQVDKNFPIKPVKENEISDEPPIVLPLIDATGQNALRRKVFLRSINKTLKNLIGELKLEETSVLPSLQELVKSFKLQAHNVVFKPNSWLLLGFILIKILSMKDENIQKQLEEPESLEHIDLILTTYAGAAQTIEEILVLLTDIDKFVECYITNSI